MDPVVKRVFHIRVGAVAVDVPVDDVPVLDQADGGHARRGLGAVLGAVADLVFVNKMGFVLDG